jgi:L-aminopeptidase/D-esterase-like protein
MRSTHWKALVVASLFLISLASSFAQRARDLGIPFDGTPGPQNAITDVPGVLVGHATIIAGEGDLVVGEGPVRTGVTAILPTGRTYRPVYAAWHALNGNGEMTGTTWIEESGFLEEPVLLTNTRSVGVVHDAVWDWRRVNRYHDGSSQIGWAALPVVAETWDGRLNDIHGDHVAKEHVFAALDGAASGAVAEGNVGGGTGMVCHRFKGGIGTSSRTTDAGFAVGVLVQANYGTRESLTIAGVPVGREMTDLMPEIHSIEPPVEGNSIIVIVATDAPLLPHQLKRLAKRVPLGIGRVGGFGSNSSGDLFLAFSTATSGATEESNIRLAPTLANDAMDPLMIAAVQATEEAIVNALIAAKTMSGINGNTVYAIPHQPLQSVLKKYHRLNRSE